MSIVLDSEGKALIDEEYNEELDDFELSYIFLTDLTKVKVDKYQLDMYLKYHITTFECSDGHCLAEIGTSKRWCQRCFGQLRVENLTCFNLDLLPKMYVNSIVPLK